MIKNRKTMLKIIGVTIIAVSLILASLIFFITMSGRKSAPDLIIVSGSKEKVYDGTALTFDDFSLVSGELKEGHTLNVVVFGSRTVVGSGNNLFSVNILDSLGNNVTSTYSIEQRYGELKVLPIGITVRSDDEVKVYDGTPLTGQALTFIHGTLLEGHNITLESGTERTDAGESENIFFATIFDSEGNDVTINYSITKDYGTLTVLKRGIAIRSASDEKNYDGTPLENGGWWIASETKAVATHVVSAIVSGSRLSVGESPNYISEVIIRDADGKNVTHNYEIDKQYGSLVVLGDAKNGTGDGTGDDGGDDGGDGSGSPTSGNGGGDLDGSGSIGGGGLGSISEDDMDTAALRIFSDKSGTVYLRYKSFGDYAGKSWLEADSYSALIDGKYSMNYLSGLALSLGGREKSQVAVEVFGTNYLLPLYLDMQEYYYDIQTSDVKYVGNTSMTYSAYYYMYDYVLDGGYTILGEGYQALERAYEQYVLNKYTSLGDAYNADFFLALSEGFSKSDPNLIKNVADFIASSATYNLEYNPSLDKEENIAMMFLSTYREGICSHYASAATLLYRALGFPARYVIGFKTDAVKDEWVDIKAYNAHAWVEVYISGMGWVEVEVTGGAGPAFGDIPDKEVGDDWEDIEYENYGEVVLKPVDIQKLYETGIVLKAKNELVGFSELKELGFSYTCEVSGSISVVGIAPSTIVSLTILSPNKVDVTDKFSIIYEEGILQLYLVEISFSTFSHTKVYDGTPLTAPSDDFSIYDGQLLLGHRAVVVMTGSQVNVGTGINRCSFKILDEFDRDVTSSYKLNRGYGTLTVTPRSITVTADSAQKVHDGKPLTANSYTISGGTLSQNHKVKEIIIVGSQTNIGKSQNIITQILIVDELGKDVTANYAIEFISGQLFVTHS